MADAADSAALVAQCFAARTAAHFLHLRSRSCAEHVALEEFYTALVDKADAYAECYMGVEGIFKSFPNVPVPLSADPLSLLTDLHDWVSTNRTKCACGTTELANLVDEILAVIDRAFYKLKFLR